MIPNRLKNVLKLFAKQQLDSDLDWHGLIMMLFNRMSRIWDVGPVLIWDLSFSRSIGLKDCPVLVCESLVKVRRWEMASSESRGPDNIGPIYLRYMIGNIWFQNWPI